MIRQILLAGPALLLALATPSQAAVTTLTFTGFACTGVDGGATDRTCTTPGQFIGGDYGSSPTLAVTYDASEATGSRTSLQFDNNGYFSGATGMAYSFPVGPADELSKIIFTPAAGYEVSLLDFGWDKITATTSAKFIFRVEDSLGNLLFSAGNSVITYDVNTAYFTGPLTFLFGNGGQGAAAVTNISVDVRKGAIIPTPGVPEPASWAMMIIGFMLTGAGLRNRRSVIA